MNKKVSFFFGAGAELDAFGLPSGSNYTRETICRKRDILYKELKNFYKDRIVEEYVGTYQQEFLFREKSHTFQEIIRNTASKVKNGQEKIDESTAKLIECIEKFNTYEDVGKSSQNSEYEKVKAELNEKYKEIYNRIILDSDILGNNSTTEEKPQYKSIEENLVYYGAVEKDFSTIINPKESGNKRFWRLINYFWSAYFVIIEGLCRNMTWYEQNSGKRDDFYRYVLDHLCEVVKSIYREYDYTQADRNIGNYYYGIKAKFNECTAITTNYTPFIEHYFGKEHSIYLAGKLCEFEYPCELAVKDVISDEIKSNDFVFPFLMTQAPVKPIVAPSQIEEYGKAVSVLTNTDILVVIGYSLCTEDNHINAILHKYVMEGGHKLIYCQHVSPGKRFILEECKEHVMDRLKLKEDVAENIVILENTGDAEQLIEKINKEIHRKKVSTNV